jgi:hypothetical protein
MVLVILSLVREVISKIAALLSDSRYEIHKNEFIVAYLLNRDKLVALA